MSVPSSQSVGPSCKVGRCYRFSISKKVLCRESASHVFLVIVGFFNASFGAVLQPPQSL